MKTINSIRLTQTVQKGGCAAKLPAEALREILKQVRFPPAPSELLIDSDTFDDAAIYQISPELALVQTLDFFTPIVDSPALFGRIAAANALSDVYAMGGKPVSAMAILAFPWAILESSVAVDILQGAADAVAEAGAAIVGGHTIDDETTKFGLSVTGFVHPDRIWSNARARPGDALILTKPLGTGTLTAALKRGDVSEADIQAALDGMCLLNDVVSHLPLDLLPSVHAATDITGFGLAGHSFNLARASGVSVEIHSLKLPAFPRTMDCLAKGFLTKAHRTNSDYIKEHTRFNCVDTLMQQLFFDPQTSGGLLLSVDRGATDRVLSELKQRFPFACEIGSVLLPQSHAINFI